MEMMTSVFEVIYYTLYVKGQRHAIFYDTNYNM